MRRLATLLLMVCTFGLSGAVLADNGNNNAQDTQDTNAQNSRTPE